MSGYRCGIVLAKMRMIYVERDQFPEKMISIERMERMFEHAGYFATRETPNISM